MIQKRRHPVSTLLRSNEKLNIMYKDRNSWNCMKEILLFQRSELYVVFVGFEYTFEYTPERGVVEPPSMGFPASAIVSNP